MKTIIALFLLVMVSLQSFGQKKTKVDPKDAQIDSLNKSVKSLAVQLDSVSKELVKYTGVYNAIREKVLHYKFDPTRSAYLIDSLKANRDSLSALLSAKPVIVPTDSIKILLNENKCLKTTSDSLTVALEKSKQSVSSAEVERAIAITGLKQLKELLDAKIITDEEFLVLKKKYMDKL